MTSSVSRTASGSAHADSDSGRDALASLRIERPDARSGSVARPRRRRWIWVLATLLVLALLGGVYQLAAIRGWVSSAPLDAAKLLGGTSDWVPDIIQNRPEVRLARIEVQTGQSANAVVVATGYLQSRRQARIGARAPGRIETIKFEEGSKVSKGEVLAILEHADLEASLAASAAQVARAKAALAEQKIVIAQEQVELKRQETLWDRQAGSASDLDLTRFEYQAAIAREDSLAAEHELAVARQREAEQIKENMFIRAPFDGTVISKDAEVGESILPGGMGEASGRGSVATIADLENLEIECDVKEDFIARVSHGQAAEIAVDAVPGHKYRGRVRKIIPMGDRARATIKVRVAITDADDLLFPEMSGTVYFLPAQDEVAVSNDQPRLFCPSSAITTSDVGEQSLVWVVDSEGHAQSLPVTTAPSRDGKSEILSGLSGAERVIVNPAQLTDDQSVKVVE